MRIMSWSGKSSNAGKYANLNNLEIYDSYSYQYSQASTVDSLVEFYSFAAGAISILHVKMIQ